MNIEDKEFARLQKSQRRKDIIKNIMIVFLLILLALTFFSRTIMNYTLPEVSTYVVQSGEISPRIRIQGTAEVDDPYTVYITQARTIKSVAVRVGQEVKRGDVLYYLEDNEPEELTNARKELADLQSSFTKKLFDGSLTDEEITRMRSGNYRSDDQMQAELGKANRRLESATREQASANKAYEKLSAQDTGGTDAGTDTGTDTGTDGNENADGTGGGNSGSGTDASEEADTGVSGFPTIGLNEGNWYDENGVTRQDDAEETGQDGNGGGSEDASAGVTQDEGVLEIKKTSAEKKLEKANNRKIDATAEYEEAEKDQQKVVSSIASELELKGIQEEINQKQAQIARLEKENIGATVTSPVDGKVNTLSYASGETTTADGPVAVIQIDGKKLTVSASVTREQAQKLKPGDEAQPVNSWEYEDGFKAVLRQVTVDSSDKNARLLKFEIDSESVEQGDSVNLQIAESSKSYDLVVPNAALRNDSNGDFVLMVKVRQSPLGNRYIATRESVKKLAQDDYYTAISGAIGAYNYVITTSTKMVAGGDQVRLSDDQETTEDSH